MRVNTIHLEVIHIYGAVGNNKDKNKFNITIINTLILNSELL